MNNMYFYKDINSEILDIFYNAEYWCFDTETCAHNEGIYKAYFIDKEKCNIKGIHARVYAWGLSNTDDDTVIYGNTLDQFIDFLNIYNEHTFRNFKEGNKVKLKDVKELKRNLKKEIGVHNLKFDAEFLKYNLINNNYKYYNSVIEDSKIVGRTIQDKCFNIVENNNTVYSMNLFNNSIELSYIERKVEKINTFTMNFSFFDTLKIVNESLDSIGKKVIKIDEKYYKMSEKYDYDSVRPIDHKLTELELNYLYNDVYILKEFLKQFYIPLDISAKTASGIAFKCFINDKWPKKSIQEFNNMFPDMYKYDFIHNIKKSYKGGWTFCYPEYRGKHLKNLNGCSIDINSSYPSVIAYKPLPYGVPKLYKGYMPVTDNEHMNLLTIEFNGFYNKFPNDKFGFFQASYLNMTEYANLGTDYLYTNIIEGEPKGYSLEESTNNRRFKYYIWEFELDSIMKHTEFIDLIVTETLQFNSVTGFFKDTVDLYIDKKNQGKKEKNECLQKFAKLVLNSFYGKLGSNIARVERTLINDDELLKFENTEIEYESSIKYYPPFASAVTAWARNNLRDTCYKLCVKEGKFEPNVLYCDTDSIYSILTSDEIIKRCGNIIDKYQLGAWDLEKEYTEFKCIGSKKYMYTEKSGELNCKCAGLPKEARKKITYENFILGIEFDGKLALKKVVGGYLLIPTKFKLNNNIRF